MEAGMYTELDGKFEGRIRIVPALVSPIEMSHFPADGEARTFHRVDIIHRRRARPLGLPTSDMPRAALPLIWGHPRVRATQFSARK